MKLGKKAKRGTRVKKLANGGNGDPTKDQAAVAESTATPKYIENSFLAYAGLPPALDPKFFRDEGTIRQTPERKPTMLQSFYEGTPLGMTEREKYEPFDKMSIFDVAAEPLKALEYYSVDANKGRLPTRAEWDGFGGSNVLDAAVAMVNPAAYVSYAMQSEAGALALLPALRPAMNAYQTALRSRGALAPGQTRIPLDGRSTPINLSAGQDKTVQLALESAEVNNARVALSQNLAQEVNEVQKFGTTALERKQITDEVADFYNRYLQTPGALEKLESQRAFMAAASKAIQRGDLEDLFNSTEISAMMPPVEMFGGLSEAKTKLIMQSPYFIGRSPKLVNKTQSPLAGRAYRINQEVKTPFLTGQEAPQDLYMLRSRAFTRADDGALEAKEVFYSNTEPGRKAAAEALIKNFQMAANESFKNQVLVTIEEMKASVGAAARGATDATSDITRNISDFTKQPVEFIDGMPVQAGPFRYNFSEAQIKMLETLTPEEFVNTLTHETNHNILLPFLDQIADMSIIEMHTIGSRIDKPMFNAFGKRLSETTPAEGFRSAQEIADNQTALEAEIQMLHPRVPASKIIEHIDYLLMPYEVQARLWEIKKVYDKIALNKGMTIEDWQYQFTPETASEALTAWQDTKSLVEGDIFENIFVGNSYQDKMGTLASVLNKTFTPAIGIGTAAVATQAKISSEEAPTMNKRGGLIKKKRRGYRSV
tara:strand:- start:6506 stop:8635 length:2130 start_codon:yes stop_codon:yes gene_type:complete